MTTVDYLRLATWNLKVYTRLTAKIRSNFDGSWEPRHWLQYAGYGNKNHSIFYGSGDQREERHYVFHCSGAAASSFFEFVMSLGITEGLYCTRIDLQQTVKHPKIDLRKVYKANPRKAKAYIQSESETVYIGSRTSDRFARLYEKLGKKWLRLEFELKGKVARSVFQTCLTQSNHNSILQNQFVVCWEKSKIGMWATSSFNLQKDVLSSDLEHLPEEYERELSRKKAYLENTEIALEKYLFDDDLAEQTRQMIERLHRVSNKLQPIDK